MSYKQTNIGYVAASSTTKELIKERPGKLDEKQFIATQIARGRQIIDDWIKALRAAENPDNPDREPLYKIYHNILNDADIIGDWETRRKLRFLGADFVLKDDKGNIDEEATKFLKKKWFHTLREHALDSKLYGISVVEIDKLTADGKIAAVELKSRRHFIPEKGLYTPKIKDLNGAIKYREDMKYVPWLFEFGGTHDLGLLSKLVPYVLFSRFALSAWSEYGEKFVMPVRIGKTQTKDKNSLNRLDKMMIEMATASYAILDKEEEFQFIETAKTDGSPVYEKLMNICAAKISKIINAAVIGEASQGGSRSKEEVGQELHDDVTLADFMWWEMEMENILPRLIELGYPFANLEFQFVRPKNKEFLWKVTDGLIKSGKYVVPGEYITETFDIPVVEQFDQGGTPKPKAGGKGGFF